jgi:hypothetical protein
MKTITSASVFYLASLLTLLSLQPLTSSAQITFPYQYSGHSIGTYTPITNATVLLDGSFDDEWVTASGFTPIAFNYSVYFNAAVSSNGYILFNGTPANFQYSPLSHISSNPYGDIVCPFGRDLQSATNGTSTVSFFSSEEVVIFQWQHVRRFGTTENFSFQVHFHINTGAISFVYDISASPSSAIVGPQVGLRGTSPAMDQ